MHLASKAIPGRDHPTEVHCTPWRKCVWWGIVAAILLILLLWAKCRG